MLDIQIFRDEPERLKEALRARQMDPAAVDRVVALDGRRRGLIKEVESLKAERNRVSKEIGRMKDADERQIKIGAMRAVGEQVSALETELKTVETELHDLLSEIPNLPDPAVPVGVDESENVVVRTVGHLPEFDFIPKAHWDLGPELGIIDFERGVKLSGSRFYILSGAGARLQRALIAWMLDVHRGQGYVEKYTPFMVRTEVVYGAGQLPKFRDNLYKDHEEDFYLVPTAEVPLTGMHMDEIMEGSELPLNYTAYSPCFRREKMSAGRDVRGIKRGHQFDKVEMYMYTRPEDSPAAFEKMVADAEAICQGLGFTYRIVQLCTGDLGFNGAFTYDIEIWSPGCEEWLEVSSISNVTDFQARRANIKYRPAGGGKVRFVHTLNGSGLALPRTLIGVLENYQQADGSVVVPEVLRPYLGGQEVIEVI